MYVNTSVDLTNFPPSRMKTTKKKKTKNNSRKIRKIDTQQINWQ